jgi:hypothetical protein
VRGVWLILNVGRKLGVFEEFGFIDFGVLFEEVKFDMFLLHFL